MHSQYNPEYQSPPPAYETLQNNQQAQLYSRFLYKIAHELDEFERQFPSGQHERIRASLLDIHNHLFFINSQPGNDENASRIKLLQAAGLIRYNLNTYINLDVNYNAALMSILTSIHFDENEAQNAYRLIRESARLADTSIATLHAYEERQFQQTAAMFQQTLNETLRTHGAESHHICQRGQQLLQSIMDEKNRSDSAEFDIKLHTSILQDAGGLLLNPDNYALQNDLLHKSTGNVCGKPSVSNLVKGGILAFVGAVLIGASLACKLSTIGLSTPATIGIMVVGGIMLSKGLAMLADNRSKHVYKAVTDFEKKAVKTSYTPTMFAPEVYTQPPSAPPQYQAPQQMPYK